VIKSFGDGGTEDLYHGRTTSRVRKFPPEVRKAARRKLDLINAAGRIDDLTVPPGNRLEALKGKGAGLFSIRINDQFRVVFRWSEGTAWDVRVVDYH